MSRALIRDILQPDDFADRPYVAGLNQMGHVTAGAAVAALVPLTFTGALVGGAVILAFEVWQLRRAGASVGDYVADLAFWGAGFGGWFAAREFGQVTGPAEWFPLATVIAGGGWMVLTQWRLDR